MNSFTVFFVAAMAACVAAEAGYSYTQPAAVQGVSFTSHSNGGGFTGGSTGGSSGWQQVAVSGGTNEGQQIDSELLNILRNVLLTESSSGSSGSSSFSTGGGSSFSTGGGSSFSTGGQSYSLDGGYHTSAPAQVHVQPATSYGVPSVAISSDNGNFRGNVGGGRVIGIQIGTPQIARQVAEYYSQSTSGGSSFVGSTGGSTGGSHHSHHVVSRPSSTYGAAF